MRYAHGNDLEHRHVAQVPIAASGGPLEYRGSSQQKKLLNSSKYIPKAYNLLLVFLWENTDFEKTLIFSLLTRPLHLNGPPEAAIGT